MPSKRTRGTWHKRKYKKYHFNITKPHVSLLKGWPQVVESSSLEILKTWVCSPEQPALADPALSRGQTRQFPEVPPILWSWLLILMTSPTTLTCIFPQLCWWSGVWHSWVKGQTSSFAADTQRHPRGWQMHTWYGNRWGKKGFYRVSSPDEACGIHPI